MGRSGGGGGGGDLALDIYKSSNAFASLYDKKDIERV